MEGLKKLRTYLLKEPFVRKIFFIVVLAIIISQGLFAQEKYGYIKPTINFGLGFYDMTGEKKILNTICVDVDFVSNLGFTFGIKNIFAINLENFEQSLYLPVIGIGYTYDDKLNYANKGDRKPSVGFKIVGAPYMHKPAIGFDIHTVAWLSKNAGISALFDMFFMKDTNYAVLLFCIGYTMAF